MLTRLRIENFKAWRNSGDLRLAPITVLFGTNSAGKTSIPQLLLLLKQTAASPDRRRALELGGPRTLVDVGTYDEAIHGCDTSRPLEVALEWTLDAPLAFTDPLSGSAYAGERLAFEARIGEGARGVPRVESFAYALRHEGADVLDVAYRSVGVVERRARARRAEVVERRARAARADARAARVDALGYELASTRYALAREPGREGPLPVPSRFYGFPDEVSASYRNVAFVSDLELALERLLAHTFYVSSLRDPPERLHLFSGEVPEHVGARGERAIDAILASHGRSFDRERGRGRRTLPELVTERLRALGLLRDFAVRPLGERRREYEVLARTSASLPEVSLGDVGFGVSQVLPVIVECFYVPRRSVVIFEQPEIHLHPRVQSELADLFVDAIRAREDGASRDCQFIIESHSEHFLRRLQRRIAEEELSRDEAALYFVHTGPEGARIEELDLDDYGNIRNWPEGFFGDEMADLVARAEAQARRAHGASRSRGATGDRASQKNGRR